MKALMKYFRMANSVKRRLKKKDGIVELMRSYTASGWLEVRQNSNEGKKICGEGV